MTRDDVLHVHVLIDSLRWGGAETLLADFAGGAPGAGVRLSVSYLNSAAGSPAAERLRAQGIEPVGLELDGLLDPGGLRRLRRHLAADAPDLVHTHLAYADLAGGLAGRSLGLPVVSTLHVMRWERSPRELAKQALIGLARAACAERVIAVSDSARAALLGTRLVRPSRLVTVRNGIVGTPRPGHGRRVRDELGLARGDLVATMLTVLRPDKGHDVAVTAVRSLRDRFPRLRLVIAGEGPSRGEIEALAAGLGDAAVVAGHRNDVMELLDATDVLLHPSRVDALPTALIEAAAACVPVVATRVGGIPEIVEDGRTGLLVPAPPTPEAVARALAELLEDQGRRAAMGAAARARFEAEFTVDRWARRVRAVYDDVLAERRGRRRARGRSRDAAAWAADPRGCGPRDDPRRLS